MELRGREKNEDDSDKAGMPKKPKIYKESEKVQHTTHWDMDYLPLKEVDALYGRADPTLGADTQPKTWLKKDKLTRFFKRLPPWLILLIVILLFARFVITLVFHLLSPSP